MAARSQHGYVGRLLSLSAMDIRFSAGLTSTVLWCMICAVLLCSASSSYSANNTHRRNSSGPYTGCPGEFLSRCRCGSVPYPTPSSNHTQFVTNCTDAGFEHAAMLTKIPIETEVLIFTGNEIKDLPMKNLFGNESDYETLHTIDLSNNRIQTIKGRTFHHVHAVRKLILNDNDIYITGKDLHLRMFSNFVNLRELHLRRAFTRKMRTDQYLPLLGRIFYISELHHLSVLNLEDNDISVVSDPNMLCALSSLEKLYLGENYLSSIPFNFTCLRHLKLIDLRENNISHLDNATLSYLEKLHPNQSGLRINLAGNPFRCDCNMIEMVTWMRHTRIDLIDKDKYHCSSGYPGTNIGKPLVNISISDLQCPLVLDEFDAHLTASYVVLGLIIVIFTVVLSVIVYLNRKSVVELAYRCADPVRMKRQYTSLDKKEEAEMEV